ncbi:hypothetical protein Droror1_Dr00020951 [Drosera rotundifolia]
MGRGGGRRSQPALSPRSLLLLLPPPPPPPPLRSRLRLRLRLSPSPSPPSPLSLSPLRFRVSIEEITPLGLDSALWVDSVLWVESFRYRYARCNGVHPSYKEKNQVLPQHVKLRRRRRREEEARGGRRKEKEKRNGCAGFRVQRKEKEKRKDARINLRTDLERPDHSNPTGAMRRHKESYL